MRKIYAIAVSCLMIAGTLTSFSSNKKGKTINSVNIDSLKVESTRAMDTLSMAFGDLYGSGMGMQYGMDATLDLDQLIEGIKFISEADTSKSFQAGIQAGMQVAQLYLGIQQQCGMPINKDLFLQHLQDALKSETPKSQDEMLKLQENISPLISRVMAGTPKAIENKKAGTEYMDKIKADKSYTFKAVSTTDHDGKTIESAIAYKVINKGSGDKFVETDNVKVNYTGRKLDGEIFDANPAGQPAVFNLQQVIPGFREMIKLMKPGEKVTVVIPGELAYGAQGNKAFGPFETLIFDIETLGIDDGEQQDSHVPQQPTRPSERVGSKPLPAKNANAAKAIADKAINK